MKLDFKKIVAIKTINDLNKFQLDEPIFHNNYLFHYLIIFDKLDILKLYKFPIYKVNDDNMNGFCIASKYNNIPILKYFIKKYPQYIYNRNNDNEIFTDYLNYSGIIKLLNLNLNWNLLLNNKIDELYNNLKYKELLLLLKKYKPEHNLHMIIHNKNLKTNEIISLLNLLETNLHLQDKYTKTIIFSAIYEQNIELVKYIISKNIVIDYYTIIYTFSPLRTAINLNFINGAKLIWNKIKNTYNYESTNRNLENIAHFLLNRDIIDELGLEILENCNSNVWSQLDINKVSPVELLIEFDFDKYNFLLKNKQVNIDFFQKDKDLMKDNIKWYNFLKTLPKIKDDNNVILNQYEFTDANLFQALFTDMCFYLLYLKNKYTNLYCPFINDIQSNSLITGDININWSHSLFENNNNIFPWFIRYQNDDEYWIHLQLNNLINSQRRSKKYDFGFCCLSLGGDNSDLHANILIYDFNNFTIERFDPTGDSVNYYKKLDDTLEEELTWNTGFTYIKPNDYMQVAGFQTISNETNVFNQKPGDFGGYCLAWCLWYLEHRIINKNIKPKELVNKLLKKLSMNDNMFIVNIRNYANKINNARITLIKDAGVDTNNISNITYSHNDNNLISSYIVNKFKG